MGVSSISLPDREGGRRGRPSRATVSSVPSSSGACPGLDLQQSEGSHWLQPHPRMPR